jgi:hypothetical protein
MMSDLSDYLDQRDRDTATNRAIQPRAVMGALAAQDDYELPTSLPPSMGRMADVGSPLIGSGGQFSAGVPWANRLADMWKRPERDPNSPVAYTTASPLVNITQADIDDATGNAMAFSGGGMATRSVPAKKVMGSIAELPKPAEVPAHETGTVSEQSAFPRPSIIERYVTDPQRIYKPGIYKDPRVIAAEANAMVAPEHPALKQLFGVTRQDLYDISQQGTRQGNVAPNIWMPQKPGGSYAAENIMNPANAQRILDTLSEARKYPGLEQGMVPWYVMDPAYQRLEQLVGPERAVAEYNKYNSMMTPFSASSDVMKEINRGTAARMMYEQGRLPDFVKYGGMPVEKRGAGFPPEMADVIPHLRHAPTHTDPVVKWAETGAHGYGQDTVKIPLYTQASGVPQTGFQTAWPVPDAHFTRAVGMSDVRKNAGPGNYMGGSEYRTFAPWFRSSVSQPLGIEAVPTQALTWGTYAPQTGVKTPIGAGKLELQAQRIWERAQKLGVNPQDFRDRVLLGEQHSELEDDNRGMGSLAALNRYG